MKPPGREPGKAEVVEALKQLAFGIELEGGNAFQARAYDNAARALKRVEGDIREMLANGELAQIRGVGKSTLAIVEEVLGGRTPRGIQDMKEKFGPGVFDIAKLKGLGPSRVRALWEELGVTSVGELEYACLENRLLDLEGFGKKSQASILAAIRESREVKVVSGEEGFRRDVALEAARAVWKKAPEARFVGELATGVEVVTRLEILSDHPLADAQKWAGGIPLVVHTAAPESLGLAEVRLTADPAHWKALQDRARTQGLVLSDDRLVDASGEARACPTSDALYAALALHPVPPERRHGDTLLVGIDRARPDLVRLEDLQGSLHNHTDESDGVDTLATMREAAHKLGHAYLAITDHSQSAKYARGLEPARLERQRAAIDAFNAELQGDGAPASEPPWLLYGVESDILPDGSLDYPDEVLADLDVVVASIHNRNRQDRATLTQRMVRAASNPYAAVLGHPTGRLLLSRPPADFDMEAVLDACAASGCAVELNAHPHRLDLSPRHLEMAKERGIPVSINADAHIGSGLGHLEHGIAVARRAGLRPEDVLNTRPLSELRAYLRTRRPLEPRAKV